MLASRARQASRLVRSFESDSALLERGSNLLPALRQLAELQSRAAAAAAAIPSLGGSDGTACGGTGSTALLPAVHQQQHQHRPNIHEGIRGMTSLPEWGVSAKGVSSRCSSSGSGGGGSGGSYSRWSTSGPSHRQQGGEAGAALGQQLLSPALPRMPSAAAEWHSVVSVPVAGADGEEVEEAEEGEARLAAAAARRQQAEAAADMLADLGPAGVESRAAVAYLVKKAGLSESMAAHVIYRARNFLPPTAQFARRGEPRPISFELEIKPTVDFLASVPGIDLGTCISKYPHILINSSASSMRRNAEAFSKQLGLSGSELGRIATHYPLSISKDISDRVSGTLEYLNTLGFTPAEQRHIIKKYPPLLSFSLKLFLYKMNWLQHRLHLSTHDIQRVIWKFPQIVCVSTERAEEQMQWMNEVVGIPQANLPHIFKRLPHIVTYSTHKCVAFLRYMQEELGLSQPAIARILFHTPDTIGRSLPRLRHNVQAMQRSGFSIGQIQQLVAANPSLLRLDFSSSTYQAKLRYLKEGFEVTDVVETLLTYPFYLSYRLDRIVTRTEYLKANGLPVTSIQAWLAMNETRFAEEWCKSSVAEFGAFVAQWRHSERGQYWLGLAAQRNSKMSEARKKLEAVRETASKEETVAAALRESEAAAERSRRLVQAQALLAEQAVSAAAKGEAEAAARAQEQADLLGRQARHWGRTAVRLARVAYPEAGEEQQQQQQQAAMA